jgi:hypothetical protein
MHEDSEEDQFKRWPVLKRRSLAGYEAPIDNWKNKPDEERRAVTGNRRRVKGKRGRALQRERSEKVERSFAHVCETGGSRRTWLHGIEKVRKRYLTSAMARNLGLVLRQLFGIGTARSLQGEGGLADDLYLVLFNTLPRSSVC